MPLTNKDEQLIDDFLRNRLSKADKILLQNRLQDADFQEAMNFRKDLQAATKKSGRAQAKNQLQQLEQQKKDGKIPQNREAKIVSMRHWWLAAAMILTLLVAGIWYWQSTENTADLYAQYYEFYPNVMTQPIVKGEQDTTALALAFQAYELKDFAKAQKLFVALPRRLKTDFYEGIIALELEEFDKAQSFFETHISNEEDAFFIPANYYLGLINLKKGIKNAATSNYFKTVKNATAYPYLQKKATEILKILEKN